MDTRRRDPGILTGVDICRPERIKKAILRYGDRFLRRVFTSGEIERCASRPNPYQCYAARFAAKEAAMKVLGAGVFDIGFSSVEVINEGTGKPFLNFQGRARQRADDLGIYKADISLSHEKDIAIAMAVALTDRPPASGSE
ncbi:Holo-[acyl-carrier-protein] synthase [hydrothermal vent metagenome]|uniref:Holo-[acyl-carrier-protein] synthase n=1 Tax=hydrothermal vent metagenome TaxID=652676 RepID=A0A3B1C8I4_9ZZZZ